MMTTTKSKKAAQVEQAELLIRGDLAAVKVTCTSLGIARIEFLSNALAEQFVEDVHRTRRFASANPWVWDFVIALQDYLNGNEVSFDPFPIDLSGEAPFRKKVLEACRQVGYGQRTTYADLACRAGNPAAMRAVGSAMSHNPLPIVIPCHRVLRSDGGLGGFSAPEGVRLKEKLLAMESAHS
jgi:methylated-DNA-[protein]-cysteine S-methyltransferase